MEVLSIDDEGDYIEVYDTDGSIPILSSAASYYRFELNMTGNSTFIRFKSNNNMRRGSGFKVTHQALTSSTPGSTRGMIRSIDESQQILAYVSNLDCNWLVLNNAPMWVEVVIDSINNDWLEVYDDINNTIPENRMVGQTGPGSNVFRMASSSSSLFARFLSYSSATMKGFRITFLEAIPGPGCVGTITNVDLTVTTTISTPNYGVGYYYSNETCKWEVVAQAGNFIRMNITVDLVGLGDDLKIFNGQSWDESDLLFAATTGSSYYFAEITSKSRYVSIQFASDDDLLIGTGLQIDFEEFPEPNPLRKWFKGSNMWNQIQALSTTASMPPFY